MEWNNVQQYIRIVGYALGSMLATAGYLNEGDVEQVIGAVTVLGSVGWFAVSQWKIKNAK